MLSTKNIVVLALVIGNCAIVDAFPYNIYGVVHKNGKRAGGAGFVPVSSANSSEAIEATHFKSIYQQQEGPIGSTDLQSNIKETLQEFDDVANRPTVMASKTCLRTFLLIYNVLFWLSGAALIFIGLWMLLEPKRNYILDLVNFSEDDPLLTFASYTAIVCGIFTCFAGFAACCGAIRAERCMILAFIVFILVLFFAELSIGALAILYREKFTGTRMKVYVANMTHNRYNRDKWVTPLLDTIQFYQQCCGGSGPMDYEYSFWYITNTERGTRSFVPYSCCKQTQTQDGRAWNLQPIDRMCITYPYFSQAFNNSVHTEGCHAKLQKWFNEQSVIFIIVGFSFAAFQIVGLIISVVYWQKLDNYRYIQAHQ
uniref:Tetraspanin n=1 Tax=Rhabditophanes sp. KR3021 TaxID=114890 RepID=A0AC35U8B1_9BILA